MPKPFYRAALLAAAALLPAAACAYEADPYKRLPAWGEGKEQEEYKWKEREAEPPPLPQPEGLLPLALDIPGYDFALDRRSLAVGADGVIRYTVVVTSRSGARNVYFEGLRCNGEYKTYAFAGSDGGWQKMSDPHWEMVARNVAVPFRFDLKTLFFCDPTGSAYRPDQIVDHIQWGKRNKDPSTLY